MNTSREEAIRIILDIPEQEMGDVIDFLRAKLERLDAESEAWLDAVEPLEPYEWGSLDPLTLGQPVIYQEGVGALVADE